MSDGKVKLMYAHPRAAFNQVLHNIGELMDERTFDLYAMATKLYELNRSPYHNETTVEGTRKFVPMEILREANDPNINALLDLNIKIFAHIKTLQHYYETTPEFAADPENIFGEHPANTNYIRLENFEKPKDQ